MKQPSLLSGMRSMLPAWALLCVIALFSSWPINSNAQEAFLANVYVSTPPEFEIHYPKNWQMTKDEDGGINFMNPVQHEYAAVSVDVVPNQGLSLKQFADKAYADLKLLPTADNCNLLITKRVP